MSATCSAHTNWMTDVVDLARRQLRDVADRLAHAQFRADDLVAQTDWQSGAAVLFRFQAGLWRDELRRVESDVHRLNDDLVRTRVAIIDRALASCG